MFKEIGVSREITTEKEWLEDIPELESRKFDLRK
jgi:hypothetical protein